MRENIKTSKIDKKGNKQLKKLFLLQNVYLIYILDKCLTMKVQKMSEHQTSVYVSTFMKILLFQVYCQPNIRLK